MAQYLRKQGEKVSLRRSDLQAQMSKNDYWIPGNHRKRFGDEMSQVVAWGISMELHPLGRQAIALEDFQAALDDRQKTLADLPGEDLFKDGDPRKGPLFAIVHAVLEKEDQKRRAAE